MQKREKLYGPGVDATIEKIAIDSLARNTMVPHEKIGVSVNKGHVTLSGEVEWRYQMKNAESAVSDIFGVKEINNHIKIKSLQNNFNIKNLFRKINIFSCCINS